MKDGPSWRQSGQWKYQKMKVEQIYKLEDQSDNHFRLDRGYKELEHIKTTKSTNRSSKDGRRNKKNKRLLVKSSVCKWKYMRKQTNSRGEKKSWLKFSFCLAKLPGKQRQKQRSTAKSNIWSAKTYIIYFMIVLSWANDQRDSEGKINKGKYVWKKYRWIHERVTSSCAKCICVCALKSFGTYLNGRAYLRNNPQKVTV